jgi:hypothetical protein
MSRTIDFNSSFVKSPFGAPELFSTNKLPLYNEIGKHFLKRQEELQTAKSNIENRQVSKIVAKDLMKVHGRIAYGNGLPKVF